MAHADGRPRGAGLGLEDGDDVPERAVRHGQRLLQDLAGSGERDSTNSTPTGAGVEIDHACIPFIHEFSQIFACYL